MMKTYRNLITLFALTFLTQFAFAQNGKLKGHITDGEGVPLPFANVAVLKAADSSLVTGAVTDAAGAFGIKSPKAGKYFLRFSAIGFSNTFSPAFEVSGPEFSKDFGSFVLKEETALLEEVEVEAMRPTIVTQADKMIVSVEGTAMAAGSTAFEVLEKSPGVWVDQDGNLNLNGKTGVKVLIDGRPTYLSAKELQTMLESMPAENIKNIEVITNPSAKYEAEGTAGILNINLKKNTLSGMNGSFYAGYQYMQMQGYSAGGNLNFKKGNWNSFLNLDVAERPHYRETEMYRQFNNNGYTTTIDQEGRNEKSRFVPSIRLGNEYAINENHSLGAMANLSYFDKYMIWNTSSSFTETDATKNMLLDSKNYTESKFHSYTYNLHYTGELDTSGTSLSADLDYVIINRQDSARFLNEYTFLNGSPAKVDLFSTENPSSFDIYSGRIDFAKPFGADSKLELGLKGSRVVSNNQLQFYQTEEGVRSPIDSMSNDFRYEENIYAAYANFSHRFNEKWNLQAGLRAEKTVGKGISESMNEETPRNYLNFFPSLFVQQHVSDDYQLNYSYSRRITRPNYQYMNPAIFYLDPYTFTKGNPYMRPQYTHAIQLTQTFQKSYNLILGYDYTTDFIGEVPEQDSETRQTYFSIGNINRFENISATLVAPVQILPKWSMNNNIVAAYQMYNTKLQDIQVQNNSFFLTAQSNHTIKLPKEFILEVNGRYRSPIAYGVYDLKEFWGVDTGIKRSFMDDKLDVSLNIMDVFRSKYVTGDANLQGNINAFSHYAGTQGFRINLRYRFNKGEKFESQNRNIDLEELDRAGGN